MRNILLIHGVNLNQLGKRDKKHYGTLTLKSIEKLVRVAAKKQGFTVVTYQSNHEGDLVDKLQTEAEKCAGIIINPGAFTHYSYALHDALLDTNLPAVEVHLSDTAQRESFRRRSVTASACIKVVKGKKEQGYLVALNVLMEYLQR